MEGVIQKPRKKDDGSGQCVSDEHERETISSRLTAVWKFTGLHCNAAYCIIYNIP